MPSYVTLINWTDQGVKNFKDSVDRYEAAQAAMGKSGARFTDVYWTIGQYDLVAIVDAPDDEAATAALLAVGAQGSIRTTTMRGFSAGEMRGIIAKAS
jgi:uncharacterized protein with GYD domain